MLENTKGRQSR